MLEQWSNAGGASGTRSGPGGRLRPRLPLVSAPIWHARPRAGCHRDHHAEARQQVGCAHPRAGRPRVRHGASPAPRAVAPNARHGVPRGRGEAPAHCPRAPPRAPLAASLLLPRVPLFGMLTPRPPRRRAQVPPIGQLWAWRASLLAPPSHLARQASPPCLIRTQARHVMARQRREGGEGGRVWGWWVCARGGGRLSLTRAPNLATPIGPFGPGLRKGAMAPGRCCCCRGGDCTCCRSSSCWRLDLFGAPTPLVTCHLSHRPLAPRFATRTLHPTI